MSALAERIAPLVSSRGMRPPATGSERLDVLVFSDRTASLAQELLVAVADCRRPGWDGAGAAAITDVCIAEASLFLRQLPAAGSRPVIAPEPDGCIAFEWIEGDGRRLMVSVSGRMRLWYSAIFPEGRSQRGEEMFIREIPEAVGALLRARFTT